MDRYKLENISDPNVCSPLESNTRYEAALEALESLGWHIVAARPEDVVETEEDEDGPHFGVF